MSCTQKECLKISKTCGDFSLEMLSTQLNKCNKCVMVTGGIKEDIEAYKRTVRGKVGMLYAQKYFHQH